MALLSPILNDTAAFDAMSEHVFTFRYDGSGTISSNRLVIQRSDDSSVVYNQVEQVYEYKHTLPANILTNGVYYKAYLIVYDQSGAESSSSNRIQFYCFTQPSIEFTNISSGGTVISSNNTFVAQYMQQEGEFLNSYSFYLYDENDNQLSTSGLQYVGSTERPPIVFSWNFSSLENNAEYKIQVFGTTVYNTEVESDRVSFNVHYEIPEKEIPIAVSQDSSMGRVIISCVAKEPLGGTSDAIVKIKRRILGDFDWVDITSFVISPEEMYNFTYSDNLARSGITYEYASVLTFAGLEGSYNTTSINTSFDAVYICDNETIFRLLENVSYGSGQRVQRVGVFEPYGSRYPIVTSNAKTNYDSGSISGMILQDGCITGDFDRKQIVDKKTKLLNFLTNKKAKIIKDFNSNIWLCMITGSPQVTYESDFAMGILYVSAEYVQIGDANSQNDLYAAGLIGGSAE